jgi:dTDP-4-dehydrorhamnose 3,5-epimerase
MKYIKTDFEGLYILQPKIHTDCRGEFYENYNELELNENLNADFHCVQENQSYSKQNVIRGLHYQTGHYAQAKIVTVLDGMIYDVAIDLREKSKTKYKKFGIVLSSLSKTKVFIPKGFAHGFSILSDCAIVNYKMDEFYNVNNEAGIRFDDPYFNIDWRVSAPIVSDKDSNWRFISEVK